MDDLDLTILRWMYPGGVYSMYGIDPRISTSEIASHVGLTRTAVWARIRQWQREGFWNGVRVHPNPGIFGEKLFRVEIPVSDTVEGGILVDELEIVDGILGASVAQGDAVSGKDILTVMLRFAAGDAEDVDRRMRVLRHLSPSGKVDGPWIDEVPDVGRKLTPLDRRIIGVVINNPMASLGQLARLVGVTHKTFARRHSALLSNHALFYRPNVDWSKHPSILLYFFCEHSSDVPHVRTAVEARFPHFSLIPRGGVGYLGEAYVPSDWFVGRVPCQTPSEGLALVLELSRLPGVRSVRPEVWGPGRSFHQWAKQRAAELLTPAEKVRPKMERREPPSSTGPWGLVSATSRR
ncbi:MAG: AsnC family transcriptional regulator [Thermoplasmata archaeon]|nr:AsnC family transcriptional regulator [Thermoplasmata archaeon]